MGTHDEFESTLNSFVDSLIDHLGRDNATELFVRPYASSGMVDVLIRLNENTWDNQLKAIERLGAVTREFFGVVSFEYMFLHEGEPAPSDPSYRELALA